MATVFESSGFSAETEVEAIQGLLEANGVPSFVSGLDVLASAHEIMIQVPAEHKELAERLIAEAQQGGPAAAEAAERAGEEVQ